MKNYASIIFMVLLCFIAFSLVITLIGLLVTRKFNKKLRKLYILFMGLSFKEVFLLSTVMLNLLITLYFIINVDVFLPIGLYMIVVTNFLSCLFSFNIHIIFMDIIYTMISCGLLWLLMTVNSYHNYIGQNSYILILIIIFVIMIIVYLLFITVRKINYLVNMHDKNGGK